MRPLTDHLEPYRAPQLSCKEDGFNGVFGFDRNNQKLIVVCSDGEGWDHVSVSLKNRVPNWDEMNFIKRMFFADEETVIQFHPKESEYVNNCTNCLHLWKKQGVDYELPPSFMVGVKELGPMK